MKLTIWLIDCSALSRLSHYLLLLLKDLSQQWKLSWHDWEAKEANFLGDNTTMNIEREIDASVDSETIIDNFKLLKDSSMGENRPG